MSASDDLDAMPERKAAERIAETKHRAGVAKMRERWQRNGFDPRAHLVVTSLEGDREVMTAFRSREYNNPDRITAWMVDADIVELLNATWQLERDKRTAAALADTKALW